LEANSGAFASESGIFASGFTGFSPAKFISAEGISITLTTVGWVLYLAKEGLLTDALSVVVDVSSLVWDGFATSALLGGGEDFVEIGAVSVGTDVGADIVDMWASLADAHSILYG
jgi:hypothetical protein